MKTWTKASPSNEISAREEKHKALARQIAAESIVLLKNDGVLPLNAPASKLALFGAGAAATIKGGTGSGEVNERHSVTIWEGLKNAGFNITTEEWLSEYVKLLAKEKKRYYGKFFRERTVKMLFGSDDAGISILAGGFSYPTGKDIDERLIFESNADTCIYVLARQAGESADRSLSNYEYTLKPDEIENIRRVAAGYKNTIVAINVGSSIDLTPLDDIEGINALIYFCQQGMEGGNAFADIITGKISPSGCLTNTWAMRYDDIPFAQEYSYLRGVAGDDREFYKEGVFVGYRYFDSFDVKPRYEFGYGLTYSDFKIECADIKLEKTVVSVSAKITNTGHFASKKTVQLYASCPSGKLVREFQSLAAFGKTKVLEPKESETLTLTFDFAELAGFDEQFSRFILEAGEYVLRLGASSRETEVAAVIMLDETAITEQCVKACPLQGELKELVRAVNYKDEKADGIPLLEIKAADIPTITHSYELKKPTYNPKVPKWLESLTTDEKIKLVMGTGYAPIERGINVPGAAAITTAEFMERGINSIALADGPAGLRLGKTSVIMKSGKIKGAEPAMEMLRYAPSFIKKFLTANPEKNELLYQYGTAFPVGTALAQTWSMELMEEFGRAVGTEMVEYGVTFWLAPGMNIQRNPLCGRNYEYYSEDPLLTGKIAAAATRGVQSFEGCYATIKHYAANNREHKRNHSDSIMSERTMREIYLKGFKIAVKEADAKSVMTSYNLLNGTYTANSHDLCTKLLRCEWGFNGVVMTDWSATGKGMADNGAAIKSGNDLIMPGGKAFFKRLKEDLQAGAVTEEELNLACANVLEAIANSRA